MRISYNSGFKSPTIEILTHSGLISPTFFLNSCFYISYNFPSFSNSPFISPTVHFWPKYTSYLHFTQLWSLWFLRFCYADPLIQYEKCDTCGKIRIWKIASGMIFTNFLVALNVFNSFPNKKCNQCNVTWHFFHAPVNLKVRMPFFFNSLICYKLQPKCRQGI